MKETMEQMVNTFSETLLLSSKVNSTVFCSTLPDSPHEFSQSDERQIVDITKRPFKAEKWVCYTCSLTEVIEASVG